MDQECEQRPVIALSLSLQALASLSAHASHGLGLFDTLERVSGALRRLGVDYVFDLALADVISVHALCLEWRDRMRRSLDGGQHLLPMLASSCPGFVCYAEKVSTPPPCPALSSSSSLHS